jgi:ornithine cyclodeaminase/alanine dehydrogenase-like protein (mu-crystallin family)
MMGESDGVLVLTNDDVKRLLDLPDYIDAVERCYRELGEGLARHMHLQRLYLPLPEPESHYWFNLHAGIVPGAKIAALRVDSGHIKFETLFGLRRMEFPGALVGLVLLFDVESGALLAIIHDHYINPIRVACVSAVGAKYLMRRDSRVLGLFGTGWQARWHLSVFMHLGRFARVVIYSPNPEHRGRFVEQQRTRFPGIEILEADKPVEVVEPADVVIVATNSVVPVFNGEWLRPGTHVVSISGSDLLDRARDVDDETVRRASIVAVTLRETVTLLKQEVLLPLIERGELRLDQVYELGDLVLGKLERSRSDEDITFHFNNAGMGIQFAAVGARMYEAALKQGIGTRLPYTWRGRQK